MRNPRELGSARDDAVPIRFGYIRWIEPRPKMTPLDRPTRDDGRIGAKMGRLMTTTRQVHERDRPVHPSEGSVAALDSLTEQGIKLVITDAPMDHVLKLADKEQ